MQKKSDYFSPLGFVWIELILLKLKTENTVANKWKNMDDYFGDKGTVAQLKVL